MLKFWSRMMLRYLKFVLTLKTFLNFTMQYYYIATNIMNYIKYVILSGILLHCNRRRFCLTFWLGAIDVSNRNGLCSW